MRAGNPDIRIQQNNRKTVKSMKSKNVKSKTTVIMGADPFGMPIKDAVKSALLEDGFDIDDITGKREQNYFDAAFEVASAVSDGKRNFGFLFCGTGAGVSIVANKFKGVSCVLCECEETARLSRVINNANILAMGGMVVSPYMAVKMARAFLSAKFTKGLAGVDPNFLKDAVKRVREIEELAICRSYKALKK